MRAEIIRKSMQKVVPKRGIQITNRTVLVRILNSQTNVQGCKV